MGSCVSLPFKYKISPITGDILELEGCHVDDHFDFKGHCVRVTKIDTENRVIDFIDNCHPRCDRRETITARYNDLKSVLKEWRPLASLSTVQSYNVARYVGATCEYQDFENVWRRVIIGRVSDRTLTLHLCQPYGGTTTTIYVPLWTDRLANLNTYTRPPTAVPIKSRDDVKVRPYVEDKSKHRKGSISQPGENKEVESLLETEGQIIGESSVNGSCCKVCMVNEVNQVFGCGHTICTSCLPNLGLKCHICRAPIVDVIDLYL